MLAEKAESKKLAQGPWWGRNLFRAQPWPGCHSSELPGVLLFLEGTKPVPKGAYRGGEAQDTAGSLCSYGAGMLLCVAGRKEIQAAAVVHRAKLSSCLCRGALEGFLNGSACQAEAGSTAESSIVSLYE